MALPPADSVRHRRQQLRRALIGWIGGGVLIALIVLASIIGGDERHETVIVPAHSGGFLDYHMTSEEYEGLHEGDAQSSVLSELGRVGLPESETPIPIVTLFPRHEESVVCSYWQITDAPETAARLCFSTPDGVLRQKLERELEAGIEGESVSRA
jgi:hypothetical protein